MSKKNATAPKSNAKPQIDSTLNAELDELLQDAAPIEVVAAATAEPIVAVVAEAANDADLEAIVGDLVAAETRAEAYAEQAADEVDPVVAEATGGVEVSTGTVTPITAAKAIKAARAPKITGAPSAHLAAMPEEDLRKVACLLTTDIADSIDTAPLMAKVDALAKKVGDKAMNLLRFNASGDKTKLQVFTRLGIEQLIAKGSVSSKDLTDHLQTVKYSLGTARSQANQLMSVLPALGVASVTGRVLTLNADSAIAAKFAA